MIIKGTSCYANAKSGNLVSITGDGGNAWGFYGNAYKKMSPRLEKGSSSGEENEKLSEDELINWYIKEFYDLRLKDLNPNELMSTLNKKYGEDIILLCHELPGLEINKEHFCHRRLLADWIELETGIAIPELSINESDDITQQEIYDLKPRIKKLIKK